MLIIRREQMNVMSEYMLHAFVSKMMIHLRSNYPDIIQNANDGAIRDFIKACVERANSFNIRAADNIQIFLQLTTLYGSEFFEMPGYEWAKAILEDEKIDETEKMNRINEYQIFSEGLGAG